jgi:MFS transporter, SHS family, lactate transporter
MSLLDEKRDITATERYASAQPTSKMTTREYLISRFTTLRPSMDKVVNPIKALHMLNREQWLFFWVCVLLVYFWRTSILDERYVPT